MAMLPLDNLGEMVGRGGYEGIDGCMSEMVKPSSTLPCLVPHEVKGICMSLGSTSVIILLVLLLGQLLPITLFYDPL